VIESHVDRGSCDRIDATRFDHESFQAEQIEHLDLKSPSVINTDVAKLLTPSIGLIGSPKLPIQSVTAERFFGFHIRVQ